MPTSFIYKGFLLVTAASQSQANALAVQLTGNDADALTFTVPLNASGLSTDQASYYVSSPLMEESYWQAILTNLYPQVAGAVYYLMDRATMTLLATSSPTAAASIGQPWTWQQTLADLGLKTIAPSGVP